MKSRVSKVLSLAVEREDDGIGWHVFVVTQAGQRWRVRGWHRTRKEAQAAGAAARKTLWSGDKQKIREVFRV